MLDGLGSPLVDALLEHLVIGAIGFPSRHSEAVSICLASMALFWSWYPASEVSEWVSRGGLKRRAGGLRQVPTELFGVGDNGAGDRQMGGELVVSFPRESGGSIVFGIWNLGFGEGEKGKKSIYIYQIYI